MVVKNHACRGSGDKTLRLWALADGTCLKTFEGHTASVLRLNFLSAGTQVTTACNACFHDFQFAETVQNLYLWLYEHIIFDCSQVSLIRQNNLQGTLSWLSF
jgi:WD40 repeat protein